MCLEPGDFLIWLERTNSLSTRQLHKLDIYWSDNIETSIDEQLHSMVQMALAERGAKSVKSKRWQDIEKLKKCLQISNPFGRFFIRLWSLFGIRNDA